MTQYAGICIGGPMAGQSLVQPRQSFQAIEHSPPKKLKQALEESVTGVSYSGERRTLYTWQHIGPFALWIHEDLDLNHALEEMAIAYSEKHHVGK